MKSGKERKNRCLKNEAPGFFQMQVSLLMQFQSLGLLDGGMTLHQKEG